MRGVKAAMTRKPWDADCPDNAFSLIEALRGYTAGGAFAGFDEGRLGTLAPGLLADIVVMDHDLESLAAEDVDQARAAVTLCGGAVTFEA